MEHVIGGVLLLGALALLASLGRRWHRRRQAAHQADALLQEVLKNKDAFRR